MIAFKKLLMGLKMEYYCLLKKLVQKLIVVINNQIFQIHLNRKHLMIFYARLKKSKKNIDMNLFKEVFGYDMPDKMLQTLHSLKRVDSYNQAAFLIGVIVVDFVGWVKKMSEDVDKNKGKEVLKIVRFLNFV